MKKLVLIQMSLFLSLLMPAKIEVLDRVAIIVNDGVIMESQIQDLVETTRLRFLEQGAEAPPISSLLEEIKEQLIVKELQLQKGLEFGVRISDGELNQTFIQIAQNNCLTLEQFIKNIQDSGQNYEKIREEVREDMIIQRVQRGLVRPKVFISDQELENYISSTEGQSSILIEYKINQILIKSKVQAEEINQKLSDGEDFYDLKAIYDESTENEPPKWQKISELPSLFSVVKNMQIGSHSDPLESGAGFYFIKLEDKKGDTVKVESQDLVRHILIQTSEIRSDKQAEELINEIKKRISEGEEFRVLARLYSDDPGSKLDGGNLGWSTSDKYDPLFKKVIDDSELNIVSEVFKSSFGFHILEVLDRRKKDISNELQKDKAFKIIFERKYEEQLERTLQELRAESYVDIKINI